MHSYSSFFFFNDTATTEIYTLSLHDALPIFVGKFVLESGLGYVQPFDRRILADVHVPTGSSAGAEPGEMVVAERSEEHTSELQSRRDLVCRLLLEKKKKKKEEISNKIIEIDT